MPYFMRKEDGKYCVYQGTAKEPVKRLRCFDDAEDASEYRRKLQPDVEDHKKSTELDTERIDTASPTVSNWESMSAEEIMAAAGKGLDSTGEVDATVIPENGNVNTDAGADVSTGTIDTKSSLTVYKSGDTYRWLAIANVAMWDREDERLTDKAYDDAVAYGTQHGCGELDLVHVDGTDVGVSDLMIRMGIGEEARLIMGGQWYTDPRSMRVRKAVEERSDYFGTSIKFMYDPSQFVDGVYLGGIKIMKCTILPRHMAASHGTAIAVLGGEKMKELDQETRDALAELNVEQDEIEALAERFKSLPDDVNVKTKEGPSVFETIMSAIQALGRNKKDVPESETANPDVAEQTEKSETEVDPAEGTQEPVEEDVEKDASVPIEQPVIPSEEAIKALTSVVVQSLAPSIKAAMQPINETLDAIKQWQDGVEKRLLETEKDIETKVVEKLASQPPVVKVRTTQLKQAETDEPIPGLASPTTPAEDQAGAFVKAVQDIVAGAFKQNASIMPDIKLSPEEVSDE